MMYGMYHSMLVHQLHVSLNDNCRILLCYLHSSCCRYLMSPEMKFVKFFGKNNDVDGLTDGMIKEIKQYKK